MIRTPESRTIYFVRTVTPERYRQLTLAALIALSAIVVTGAAVRLTGSGLGCSDWPICETDQPIPALDGHAWIEFGNRLVTGLVSLAVALAVLGSRRRVPRRRDLTVLSLGLVAGVIAQIIVGAITVIFHLAAGIVMLHFLLSMVLVANATVLHVKAGDDPRIDDDNPGTRRADAVGLDRRLINAAFAWVWVVAVTGTVLTSAGPHRGDPDVEPLQLDIPWVARIHGVSVVIFLGLMVWLAVRLRRQGGSASLISASTTVLLVAVSQAAVGYTQYFNGVPVGLVALHIAGATALFISVTVLWMRRDSVTVDEVPIDRTDHDAVVAG